MFNLLFSLVGWILRVAEWVLIIYFIMKIAVPQNKYTLLAGKYMEIALAPVRKILFGFFPKLSGFAIDFSPIALLFVILLAQQLAFLLRRIPL